MASKHLPLKGEYFLGQGAPGQLKIAKVRIGFNTGDVQTGAVQAAYDLFVFDVPVLVVEVLAYTAQAWTTSVTLNVGDADAANGWLATAKVAPTSAQTNNIAKASDVATADTNAGGKFYAAGGKIQATIGGANPAVGYTDIYVRYYETAGL